MFACNADALARLYNSRINTEHAEMHPNVDISLPFTTEQVSPNQSQSECVRSGRDPAAGEGAKTAIVVAFG